MNKDHYLEKFLNYLGSLNYRFLLIIGLSFAAGYCLALLEFLINNSWCLK